MMDGTSAGEPAPSHEKGVRDEDGGGGTRSPLGQQPPARRQGARDADAAAGPEAPPDRPEPLYPRAASGLRTHRPDPPGSSPAGRSKTSRRRGAGFAGGPRDASSAFLETANRLLTLALTQRHSPNFIHEALEEALRATRGKRAFLARIEQETGELVVGETAGDGWTSERR